MHWIRNGHLKWITKDGRRFREADAMLREIRGVLRTIPFEFHGLDSIVVSVIRIHRHNACGSLAVAASRRREPPGFYRGRRQVQPFVMLPLKYV